MITSIRHLEIGIPTHAKKQIADRNGSLVLGIRLDWKFRKGLLRANILLANFEIYGIHMIKQKGQLDVFDRLVRPTAPKRPSDKGIPQANAGF
jgi:hypothetical protein